MDDPLAASAMIEPVVGYIPMGDHRKLTFGTNDQGSPEPNNASIKPQVVKEAGWIMLIINVLQFFGSFSALYVFYMWILARPRALFG